MFNFRFVCLSIFVIVLFVCIYTASVKADSIENKAASTDSCNKKIINEKIPKTVYETMVPRALTSFEFRQATYGYQLSFDALIPVWKVNHDTCNATLQRIVISSTMYSTTTQAKVLSYSSPIFEVKGQILVTIEPTTGRILNMTRNLPSLPLISTVTLGPTGSNCAQKISDEENKRSDLIYYQKAPFTVSTSKEFRAKTKGYQLSWNSLSPVWNADTKMCTLSLEAVKVGYTVHGSINSHQDFVVFVDPTMNVILNMTDKISIPPIQNDLANTPPLKQIKAGIVAQDVSCKDGLQLVIKVHDNSPACVRSETVQKLIERGWSKHFIGVSTLEIPP